VLVAIAGTASLKYAGNHMLSNTSLGTALDGVAPSWVLPLGFVVLALGCGGARPTHRNPTFTAPMAPTPTLVTRTIACLEAPEVASGGMRIRRDAGLGPRAVMRMDEELSRMGPTVIALPKSLCRELTSDQAAHAVDFNNPEPPRLLADLLKVSQAQSLLVPVISTDMHCDRNPRNWRYGEPAYVDESGEVDCYETTVSYVAFLFCPGGELLWKGYHVYDTSNSMDAARAANALLESAPVAR